MNLRCEELQLIDRCHPINSRQATLDEILLKHTKEQYDILEATSNETNEIKLEELSSHYDGIYIHPVSWCFFFALNNQRNTQRLFDVFYFQSTFELSKLSVGCTIELVDSILNDEVQNGMAIIRPPGHHAMKSEYNGYCFFNNVAIAAQHALNNHGVSALIRWTQIAKFNHKLILFFYRLRIYRFNEF